MYLVILTLFLVVFIYCLKRIKQADILRMSFWVLFAYAFLVITHLFSGIKYHAGNVYSVLPYLLVCVFLIFAGEYFGSKIKSKNSPTFQISIQKLGIFSIFGSVLFLFDLFRLNTVIFGLRIEEYSISLIGVLGNALSSMGVIVWLTSLYHYRIHQIKIPFLSYLAVVAYVSGGIAQAGRQAVLLILISSFILYMWTIKQKHEYKKVDDSSDQKSIKAWGIIVISIIFVAYFLFISFTRSQIFIIDNKIAMLEAEFNAKVSDKTLNLVHKAGVFSDIYIESLFYYSHELVRLDVIYKHYDYHVLYGLSQLSYIERRLQWLFGNQGDLSWLEVEKAVEGKGKFSSHTWGTFITNFIVDFGRFGTLIVCFIVGLLGGIFHRKFLSQKTDLTIVRQCLICAGAVFSIQFSPFAELMWTLPLVLSSFIKLKVKTLND